MISLFIKTLNYLMSNVSSVLTVFELFFLQPVLGGHHPLLSCQFSKSPKIFPQETMIPLNTLILTYEAVMSIMWSWLPFTK